MPKQSTNSAGSAASGAPKFFIPGGVTNTGAKENSFAPTWGGVAAVSSTQPASPVPQSALPQQQASQFAQATSPRQPVSPYERAAAQPPPLGAQQPSPRVGQPPQSTPKAEEEKLTWQDWRRQDEVREVWMTDWHLRSRNNCRRSDGMP